MHSEILMLMLIALIQMNPYFCNSWEKPMISLVTHSHDICKQMHAGKRKILLLSWKRIKKGSRILKERRIKF